MVRADHKKSILNRGINVYKTAEVAKYIVANKIVIKLDKVHSNFMLVIGSSKIWAGPKNEEEKPY